VAGDFAPETRAPHRVLIVDDYDDTRDALAAMIGSAGFQVESAWGAEDALRHLRVGFRPCVALLDLRMPGMDGWALWDKMKADPELARIAVVLVSGDMVECQRAEDLGIRELITKPVEPDALIAAIERHCRETSA
jgi:CheY-like chemotaxis protein